MKTTLNQAIADYIDERKQIKLAPIQKALDKVLAKSEDDSEIAEARAQYNEAAAPVENSYKVDAWLSDAARRAKQISLATHAPKFTHGDAKGSSILVNELNSDNEPYVITAKNTDKAIDAVGNAAALDVAKLLKIRVNGESLITQLQDGHINALRPFTNDSELLNSWQQGFLLALGDAKLTSHHLNKQLYFPVVQDDGTIGYHLLCPLYSSALAHQLYSSVTETRFGESKDIREARRNGKYHEKLDQSFPATAVQLLGGSKPQNVSLLNSERYGQNFLLNAAPPQWQHQTKPPLTRKTLFDQKFSYKVFGYLRDFRIFLENLKKNERNFKTRYERDQKFILPIVDVFLSVAANIQAMQEDAGWSGRDECQLKYSHCLWLDLLNPDESFQRDRDKGDWLIEIANDFASWLAKKIKSKKYILSDVEHNYFKKICLGKLQKFERATPKLGEF